MSLTLIGVTVVLYMGNQSQRCLWDDTTCVEPFVLCRTVTEHLDTSWPQKVFPSLAYEGNEKGTCKLRACLNTLFFASNALLWATVALSMSNQSRKGFMG